MQSTKKAIITCETIIPFMNGKDPALSGVTCTISLEGQKEAIPAEFVDLKATKDFKFKPSDYWSPVITSRGEFMLRRRS